MRPHHVRVNPRDGSYQDQGKASGVGRPARWDDVGERFKDLLGVFKGFGMVSKQILPGSENEVVGNKCL